MKYASVVSFEIHSKTEKTYKKLQTKVGNDKAR